MKENFEKSLGFVLAHEGGYVDHPKDPGGATNRGITQRTLSAFIGRQASKQDVIHLSKATAAAIYRKEYWDAARCDDLPAGVDYAVFDAAVNSGVSRSAKWLQAAVRAKQDGVIGANTIAAVRGYNGTSQQLIATMCETRMSFLKRLSHWSTFKTGWTRRVIGHFAGVQTDDIGVLDRATYMARGYVTHTPKIVADNSGTKADDTKMTFIGRLIEAIMELFK